MNLNELGEFGLIARIAARSAQSQGVTIGIGDDAAAVAPTPGHLTLVTTDMLIEGIHFDLSFTAAATLGRKSLAVNLSDIAAMGGKPRHALLSLALPRTLPVEFIDDFIDGLLGLAAEHDVALIGGDTCASSGGLVISLTVMGEQLPERVVRRDGARPGDLVFVTGTLGDAALGLELLKQGVLQGEKVLRQLDPTPRVREGQALAATGLPTAMIDVSDGLLADLGHILRLSGVGACLELDTIPLSDFLRSHTAATSGDPLSFSLSGGEDYELLFTAPPAAAAAIQSLFATLGTPVTPIGAITSSPGISTVFADGRAYQPRKNGYNHFQ